MLRVWYSASDVIRTSTLFRADLKGAILVETGFGDARIDQFWEENFDKFAITIPKKSTYLIDRFFSAPDNFRLFVLEKDHMVRAFSIVKFIDVEGTRCGLIVELMTLPEDSLTFSSLLRATLRRIKNEGCEVAWVWSTSQEWQKKYLGAMGFVPYPTPLHFLIGGDLVDNRKLEITGNPDLWSFSHGDSDIV